jgi:thymidylate kinase
MPPDLRRADRARTERGAFIGLVGPDGSGKTTTAAQLRERCATAGRPFVYVHWRPSLRSPFREPDPNAEPLPKVRPLPAPSALQRGASLARLARSACIFNIAYALRIRPLVRNGTVVVADRWIYNYVAQPHSVRYYGSPRLAAFVCRRLVVRPRPVFVFEAPPHVILARSDELSADDVAAEYERVRRGMPGADVVWIDATARAADIAGEVLAHSRLIPRAD